MSRIPLRTLPPVVRKDVYFDLIDKLWRSVLDHDLDGLVAGLSEDYIFVLLSLDRALRTAGNLGRDEDLAWAMNADEQLRGEIGRAQGQADALRLDLSYALGEICLIAGAGLSQAAGLPGWKDLVIALLRDAEERVTKTGDLESLRRSRRDLEAVKDYTTADLFRATRSFEAAAGHSMNSWLREGLLKRYRNLRTVSLVPTSEQHEVIARMLWSRRPGHTTPGLNALVTYNFDDLLELHLAKLSRRSEVHVSVDGEWKAMDYSSYAAGDWFPEPSEHEAPLRIFHPHGFLPYYDVPDLDFESIDCVFSESAYDQHYGHEYTFAKRVQRSLFRSAIGLFIGTSFMDDRLQKELEEAHSERPGWFHYALMADKEAAADDAMYLSRSERFAKWGVRPIWLPSHDGYPEFLLDMANVSAERWNAAWNILRGEPKPDAYPAPRSGVIRPRGAPAHPEPPRV